MLTLSWRDRGAATGTTRRRCRARMLLRSLSDVVSRQHIFPRSTRPAFPGRAQDRTFILRAEAVAKIAGEHAADVDDKSRFPAEAFAALREQKLLGMMIPTELGGEGARAADVADVCAISARPAPRRR